MIEQLFGSKTRVKLLQLFYGNPNRPYYVREITRKIDEQINSVRRELANLLSIGIISSETNNNKLYYEVNQEYEYFVPLEAIFGAGNAGKVSVVSPTTKQEAEGDISSVGNVELALYTGQFTRDETSGIDLLVMGDINSSKLANYVSELESRENKEIRYATMTLSEYKYRAQVNDRFLSNVMSSKVQVLIDKQHLITPKMQNSKSKNKEQK